MPPASHCRTRRNAWRWPGARRKGVRRFSAAGSDERGLVYALLEVADRVNFADNPLAALEAKAVQPVSERPANAIRGVSRAFVSDVEDKAWFQDRDFWPPYLTMLAAQRFNRFNLALGIGYDFATDIRDCYLHFAYPFLLAVPGYAVRATPLPDAERDRNLDMLRFISEESARRGLHFQLGLWTHAYQWTKSPNANYTIEGLTPESHAPYCRDALRALPGRLSGHPRRDPSHPRRKRRAGGELRLLENYISTAWRQCGRQRGD